MRVRIAPAGDAALVVELEARIDPAINARATAIARAFRATALPHVHDVVIGYCSVTVHFDPWRADADAIATMLESLSSQPHASSGQDDDSGPTIEVPVCYGGEYGPDLADVAAFAGVSEEEVIRLHADRPYRVFMVGFVPGFPFLGTVESRIAMPRRDTPRPRVPARSVGIAGVQTGVYPMETPGGWRLVGRTPLQLSDPSRPEWCLLQAGDSVIFRAIEEAEYRRLER
jgi:inhibitor of KinA